MKKLIAAIAGFLIFVPVLIGAAAGTEKTNVTTEQSKIYQEVANEISNKYGVYLDWLTLYAVDITKNKSASKESVTALAEKFIQKKQELMAFDFSKYVSIVDAVNKEKKVNIDWRYVVMLDSAIPHTNDNEDTRIHDLAVMFISPKNKVLTIDQVLKANGKDINNVAEVFRNVNDIKPTMEITVETYEIKPLETVVHELQMDDQLKKIQNIIASGVAPVVYPSNGTFAFPSPEAKTLTSPYGIRFHPIEKKNKMHWGIDLGGGSSCFNSPILSIYDGKVISVEYNYYTGNTIKIEHQIEGKVWYSRYCHLNSVVVVKDQTVLKGQQIGTLGSTGKLSTGPHLHFEISPNGQITDPYPFIFN